MDKATEAEARALDAELRAKELRAATEAAEKKLAEVEAAAEKAARMAAEVCTSCLGVCRASPIRAYKPMCRFFVRTLFDMTSDTCVMSHVACTMHL